MRPPVGANGEDTKSGLEMGGIRGGDTIGFRHDIPLLSMRSGMGMGMG